MGGEVADLGLPVTAADGEQTPYDKTPTLGAHRGWERALMIGDGANHLRAFSERLPTGRPPVDRGAHEESADF